MLAKDKHNLQEDLDTLIKWSKKRQMLFNFDNVNASSVAAVEAEDTTALHLIKQIIKVY